MSLENSYSPTIPGWVVTGSVGTTYEVPWSEASPAPEGDQYAYADSTGWTIRQNGPVIAGGRRYILTADVYPLSTGSSSISVLLRNANNGSVLAGAGNFASANPAIREVETPEGQWTSVSVGFHSDQIAGVIGGQLEVRFTGSRFAIDNVRLVVDDSVHDFYVGSSATASGDGFSAESPLSGFDSLAPYLPLLPGERVLLKAGDVFSEELNIRGKGTEQAPITVSRYGEGPNPVIRPDDIEFGRGLVWNNPSHARISGIDVERAKIGVYLRYEWTDPGGVDVLIENSNFRDLSDPTLEPSKHNFEYAWSDAIWVGGQAWNDAEFSTRLDGLTIRNVTAIDAAHLFGTGWYFPATYRSRVTNLIIEDCVAINNLGGAFQLFAVDGARISRVHSISGGGKDTWSGTTLGFLQDSKNILIEDSEFAYIDRAQSADGSGMDFEGNTENVTFRNNVVHNNAGSALLILGTNGRHKNLVIEGNVFYNNARDPWNSEINSEIQGSNDNHTGIIRNNSVYRGDASINFFSPNSNWSGFQISGNKTLEYDSVRTLQTRWEFDVAGDFLGWGGFNQWNAATVAGGLLSGESAGVDPYVVSPLTWVNSGEKPYAWIRMSQSAGSMAQVFFVTETDPVWNAAKSVFVPIVSDGQMHDYFVDLGAVTKGHDVIRQIRIDPTTDPGAVFSIDFVRMTGSPDPSQAPPPQALPAPQAMTFTSIASEDGDILESAADTGQGGFVDASSTTFRLGDDANNRAYRQFLSFNTFALPDDAVIVSATIGITRVGNPTGSIPIGVATSQFGDLIVDLASPAFGGTALTAGDWEAAPTIAGVSKFAWPAYLNGQTLYSRLEDVNNPYVNVEGRTQFRVRYQNDDDGDFVADYMSYATGNHSNAAYRPTLSVEYYLPSTVPGDYDLSGAVDEADYVVWRSNYGATYGVGLLADGNKDGRVDAADYTIWRDNLGNQTVVASSAAVFETVETAKIVGSGDTLLPRLDSPAFARGPAIDATPEKPSNSATGAIREPIAASPSTRLALLLIDDALAVLSGEALELVESSTEAGNVQESDDLSQAFAQIGNEWSEGFAF